jgi:hypothetical protein
MSQSISENFSEIFKIFWEFLVLCKHLLDFTVIVFALEMILENKKTKLYFLLGRARMPAKAHLGLATEGHRSHGRSAAGPALGVRAKADAAASAPIKAEALSPPARPSPSRRHRPRIARLRRNVPLAGAPSRRPPPPFCRLCWLPDERAKPRASRGRAERSPPAPSTTGHPEHHHRLRTSAAVRFPATPSVFAASERPHVTTSTSSPVWTPQSNPKSPGLLAIWTTKPSSALGQRKKKTSIGFASKPLRLSMNPYICFVSCSFSR